MKKTMNFLLVLLAATPLLYTSSVLSPFISPKNLFLRGVIFIISCLFIWLFASSSVFKTKVREKIKTLWKQSLVKIVALSYVLLAVSTIFAYNRYIGFFGEVIRGEGFIGLTFFYLLFLFFILLFEKKDWLRFFEVTLGVNLILFIGELVQIAGGNTRPSASIGNPIFLAAYLLFAVFAGFAVSKYGVEAKNTWLVFAGRASMGIAFVGIFLTQSRGVMLGVFFGILSLLVYLFVCGKNAKIGKNISARKFAGMILAVLVICGGMFFSTKDMAFWRDVPGLNRIANFNFNDSDTQARLFNYQISLTAINPAHVSPERFVFGWGWDNFEFAWYKFYQPKIYSFDSSAFDRAHDKLLDVLVMTGIAGLVAYLLVWIVFVRYIFEIGKRSLMTGAFLLFWAVAFFVQNLTGIDSIVTFIAFYAMLAFALHEKMSISIPAKK